LSLDGTEFDELDLDSEELEDDDTESADADSAVDDALPDSKAKSKPGGPKSPDKRINDLMGKWQAAEARSNTLKSQLEQVVRSGGDTRAKPVQGGLPPEVQAWLTAVRDAEIDRVYGSDPRFESYGIDRGDLVGESPDEIRASADRYKKLLDQIETKAKNEVQRQFGIIPDMGGSRRGPQKDLSSLNSADFLKELDGLKRGF